MRSLSVALLGVGIAIATTLDLIIPVPIFATVISVGFIQTIKTRMPPMNLSPLAAGIVGAFITTRINLYLTFPMIINGIVGFGYYMIPDLHIFPLSLLILSYYLLFIVEEVGQYLIVIYVAR